MTQWDLCPNVQYALDHLDYHHRRQQIVVMVEPKAPKHVDSVFLVKVQAFHSCLWSIFAPSCDDHVDTEKKSWLFNKYDKDGYMQK